MYPELACYRPVALAAEFRRTLKRELDFQREGRNLQQFRQLFADNDTIRIPRPYLDFSTERVLTMEMLDGVKLSDADKLPCSQLDLAETARRGADIYMEMIFIHGQFHADPHPGNIVLLRDNVIGLLDFGMVGRLDETLREDIAEMLMAIIDRDESYLTRIIMHLGHTPRDLDVAAMRLDVGDFVDHYGNQPVDEFDLSGALRDMVRIIRAYHIVLPGPVAMLLKVLIMLEGTAQLLDPHFSLMEVIQPYRRKMLLQSLSPRRRLRRLRRTAHEAEQLLEELPRRMTDILEQVESGQFDVHLDHRGLEPSVNRLVLGMLSSAMYLGSSILISRGVGPRIYDIPVIGACGLILGVLLGLRVLRAIAKSGHLDRMRK
jgi:ubiquinone biosynthesis protein